MSGGGVQKEAAMAESCETDPLSARIQRYHADMQAADDAHTFARTRLQEAFAADMRAMVGAHRAAPLFEIIHGERTQLFTKDTHAR